MAIDWRKRRAVLGNKTGGLSGPALEPLALRIVWQVARAVRVPIIGVGGISTIDDVMEFIVAGASAVQLVVVGAGCVFQTKFDRNCLPCQRGGYRMRSVFAALCSKINDSTAKEIHDGIACRSHG